MPRRSRSSSASSSSSSRSRSSSDSRPSSRHRQRRRRSRSSDYDDRKSKKYKKKSKSHRRRSRSRDRGSRWKTRRSRSRSRDRKRSRERRRSPDRRRKSPTPDNIPSVPNRFEVQEQEDVLSKIRRDRAIADIDASGFQQATFSSSSKDKIAQIALPGEAGSLPDGFAFGTAAELASVPPGTRSSSGPGSEKERVLDELNKEGLCHPNLFADESVREQKWINYLFQVRQKILRSSQS